MPDVNAKKPEGFRLPDSSMPSVARSYELAADVIARHVGRTILATSLEFIDRVIDNMICFNRAALRTERPLQRECVARAGARMFDITVDEIGMARYTRNPVHMDKYVPGVWINSTNEIVALDCAGLGFEHFEMIERLIMSSRHMRTPLPYIESLLHFYGIGAAAGPSFTRIPDGCLSILEESQGDPAWTRLMCNPSSVREVIDAFLDCTTGLTGTLRRPEQLIRDDAMQRAYDFCRGCASYKGASQWRANQTTSMVEHMEGIRRIT